MQNFLQRYLIRFIAGNVFHTLTKEDFLAIKGDKWEWKGKEMNDDTKGVLKAQAKTFSESTLWKVLKSEMQWRATKTLLEEGTTASDLRIAQVTGYLTRVIDDKLVEMSK